MSRAQPHFAADSIGKSYGRRTILKSASVWAWPGKVTAVLGRNGSGKSTLMRIGAGVLRADHGTVRLGDRVSMRPRLHSLARRGLWYVPDSGGIPLTATLRSHLRSVAIACAQRNYYATSGASLDADAVAQVLGMTHLLDAPMIELSGGEMKRAQVAVAIARRPLCLIADEPFAGISPIDAEQISHALSALRANGCAIIVSGHEVPSILDLADEVVWVTAGTTHALGSPSDARRHHQFCREYLGLPAIHSVA